MSSNFITRWGLPLGLIGCGILLSAFVFLAKLPPAARLITPRTVAAFLGTPAIALTVLLGLRGASGDRSDRSTDLVIVWVVTFLFGVHAAVLAAVIGLVPSMKAVVPSAVAILLIGLGPAIGTLQPGSPLGIRTERTLRDDALWSRTHRILGWSLGLAGLCGVIGARLGGPWALVAGVGPAVIALIFALGYGSLGPMNLSDEEMGQDERLPTESGVDATDS